MPFLGRNRTHARHGRPNSSNPSIYPLFGPKLLALRREYTVGVVEEPTPIYTRLLKASWLRSGKRYVLPNTPTSDSDDTTFGIQRSFQLDTINIQDKGQEQWKKKYVYWIPALHLEGKEIAKGRWDAQTVMTALAEWDKKNEQTPTAPGTPPTTPQA